jgi:threonyl-tRNA synthetase
MWDQRREALLEATPSTSQGLAFTVSDGEGAFYGPKLEFHVTDAIGRSWQLGTIQVDYNLPERFEPEYIGADNTAHRPVMLHRAVLGSIERFLSVYIEHTAGASPVWLAPEQVACVTVADRHLEYAHTLAAELRAAGLRPTVDASNDKLGAKIRTASLLKVPYIAVVGRDRAPVRGELL